MRDRLRRLWRRAARRAPPRFDERLRAALREVDRVTLRADALEQSLRHAAGRTRTDEE
jgi:hypothetical protein